MNFTDVYYMELALRQAERAFKLNEVPIGALIVDNHGEIIARGFNLSETKHAQSRHAEVIAIERAGKKRGGWRLDNCTIYVTLEPCMMCIGLIAMSRLERIVYGAKSPLFGYDLDKESLPELYKKQIRGISQGVLAEKAELLLKNFFRNKRNKRE
jgi:tRNA(adenine34) deaminase